MNKSRELFDIYHKSKLRLDYLLATNKSGKTKEELSDIVYEIEIARIQVSNDYQDFIEESI